MGIERDGLKDCDDAEFIGALADICDVTAHLVLNAGDLVDADKSAPDAAMALREKKHFEDSYPPTDDGREHPPNWIARIVSSYLAECAHLCLGLAAQLRAHTFVIGIDLSARSVVERAGRLKWILDPSCSAHQRFARAGLEMTVCQQYYRQTIDQLKAPTADRKHAQAEHRRYRRCLDTYFETIQKPPSDPCDGTSEPSPDATTWVVDGETYPNYTQVTAYALDGMAESTSGTYAAYSGLTHPNVQASGEHRRFAEDGRISYVYTCADLEKAVRTACFATIDALRHVIAYSGGDSIALQERIDAIAEAIESISLIGSDGTG